MRLTSYTDYSLRLLMYVAIREEEIVTVQEVSEAYGISKNHLMKVAYQLGKGGFLETIRGRSGGVRLGRPPEQIGIGEVVRAMEEDCAMVECFKQATSVCVIGGPCRLRGILVEALRAYWKVLDRYTLADLVAQRSGLAKILLAG